MCLCKNTESPSYCGWSRWQRLLLKQRNVPHGLMLILRVDEETWRGFMFESAVCCTLTENIHSFLYLLCILERTNMLRWRRRSRLRWRRHTPLCSPRHSNRPNRSRYSKGPSIPLHRCTLLTGGDSWEGQRVESVSIVKCKHRHLKPAILNQSRGHRGTAKWLDYGHWIVLCN